MSRRSSVSEASMGSAGDEDLQPQIDRLYRMINEAERPGEYRQNHKSGEFKKYRARQEDRRQLKEWKAELEKLTRRQNDRDEAARQYQERMDLAAERERQEEEDRRAESEARRAAEANISNRFVVRSVGISHLDSRNRRSSDEVAQKVFRISQIHTISPAELVRETERDPELEFVRQALLNN